MMKSQVVGVAGQAWVFFNLADDEQNQEILEGGLWP
jgi:hypothetical protein